MVFNDRDTLAMIPSKESEENRRKNKSGDYEVSTQASTKRYYDQSSTCTSFFTPRTPHDVDNLDHLDHIDHIQMV